MLPAGSLDPNEIHIPGIFVQRIFQGKHYEKRIEQRTVRPRKLMLDKIGIAKRIAKEVKDGYYVNLGIGIPTLVANFVRDDISVEFQSENGVLGMGPFPFEGEEDADIINAGKQTITTLPGASFFDSATSFGMIRGKHVHLTILGAMEVAENGDIANWKIPGKNGKRHGRRNGFSGFCR